MLSRAETKNKSSFSGKEGKRKRKLVVIGNKRNLDLSKKVEHLIINYLKKLSNAGSYYASSFEE